jgi:hypothetical protein
MQEEQLTLNDTCMTIFDGLLLLRQEVLKLASENRRLKDQLAAQEKEKHVD